MENGNSAIPPGESNSVPSESGGNSAPSPDSQPSPDSPPSPDPPQSGSNSAPVWKQLLFMIGVYTALMIFCSLGVIAFAEPAFFALGLVGIAMGTLQLCSLGAALGPGPYWLRATLSLIAGVVVAGGGMLGVFITTPDSLWREFLAAGFTLGPSLWMVGQLPHLALRHFFGWHMSLQQSRAQSLSIFDIMCLTGLVAFSLGSLRFAMYLVDSPQLAIETVVGQTVAAVLAMAVLYLVLVLPALYFCSIHSNSEAGCSYFALYLIGMLVLGLGALAVVAPRLPTMAALAPIGLIGATALFFCLPLMFARQAGIRLWLGHLQESAVDQQHQEIN